MIFTYEHVYFEKSLGASRVGRVVEPAGDDSKVKEEHAKLEHICISLGGTPLIWYQTIPMQYRHRSERNLELIEETRHYLVEGCHVRNTVDLKENEVSTLVSFLSGHKNPPLIERLRKFYAEGKEHASFSSGSVADPCNRT
jgi:hypothetical protein